MAQTKRDRPASSTKRGSSSSSTPARPQRGGVKTPRRREIMAAVCFILAAFTCIGYFNTEGAFIGFFIGIAMNIVGLGFYALAPALLICAVILSFHRGRPVRFRTVCALLLSVVTGALMHLFTCDLRDKLSFGMFPELWNDGKALKSGGALGGAIAEVFNWLFSKVGAAIVLICATVFLLMSALNITIAGIVDAIRKRERRQYVPEPDPEPEPNPVPVPVPTRSRSPIKQHNSHGSHKKKKAIDIPIDDEARQPAQEHVPEQPKEKLFKDTPRVKTPDQLISEYAPEERKDTGDDSGEVEDLELDIPFMEKKKRGTKPPAPPLEDSKKPEKPVSMPKEKIKPEQFDPLITDTDTDYSFPPVELLPVGAPKTRTGDNEARVNSERLEAAFQSFGVNVSISNTTRGPTVTRYEAELEPGIKLSKLTSLTDDIAMALGTSAVRIAAMPNRISTVGIEVPNKKISVVYLRDIIEAHEFTRAKSKLTFAIGMDISGDAIVGNVSKLPHLLVAGTTGSGKSVCLNSIILSLLYKAMPEDLRFIMIDPKMVEFKVYNNIPHLLVPIVTDVKKAAGALQWAVFEMMKRYKLFEETSSRDLEGYNHIARNDSDRETLPRIVVVIDELADLMMMAAKEVEESVCRVAQMGRAAGIHLIIATQSPRADVITGLMKANIPSRISFKVSSALESRIILDAGGNADKLVGNGDMLYAPTGTDKPMRVQGTWVSDKDRERVVGFIKKGGESRYSEEVIAEIEKAAVDRPSGDKSKDEPESSSYDELLPQAVEVIFETGQASVSMLQRRLKLGYSRAARIVDQMEQMGVVGPFEGSKPRAMLITKEQWRQMQYVNGTAPVDRQFPEPVKSISEYSEDDYIPD